MVELSQEKQPPENTKEGNELLRQIKQYFHIHFGHPDTADLSWPMMAPVVILVSWLSLS